MFRLTCTTTAARHHVPPIHRIDPRLRFTELAAGDTATIRAVFEGLSPRSRYQRFHAGRSVLSTRMQQLLADVRPGRHHAHVAILGGRPVGIVRWIRYEADPLNAELAIEVIDDAQSSGIGRQLAAHAARSALTAGVRDFLAYIDESNSDLRDRTLSYGASVDRHDRSLLRLPVAALLRAVQGPAPAREWEVGA